MSKYQSRGPNLDLDKVVEESGGNRFQLIIEAAARARQIRNTNKSSDRFEHTHPCMTALLEIQEGKHKE